MKRRSADVVAAACAVGLSACVSFDPSGPPAPDISGSYVASVVTSIVNDIETRTDTFTATLELGSPTARGRFLGIYRIDPAESGPFGGEFLSHDGRLNLTTFGEPPKPIAGVAHIRALYPWCNFPLLGIGPLPGVLQGDTLTIAAQGSVPCVYNNDFRIPGPVSVVHTEVFLSLRAVR